MLRVAGCFADRRKLPKLYLETQYCHCKPRATRSLSLSVERRMPGKLWCKTDVRENDTVQSCS